MAGGNGVMAWYGIGGGMVQGLPLSLAAAASATSSVRLDGA